MSAEPIAIADHRHERESMTGLRMELQVCRADITTYIDKTTPALDALEAATLELGPLAHQHVARIRYWPAPGG